MLCIQIVLENESVSILETYIVRIYRSKTFLVNSFSNIYNITYSIVVFLQDYVLQMMEHMYMLLVEEMELNIKIIFIDIHHQHQVILNLIILMIFGLILVNYDSHYPMLDVQLINYQTFYILLVVIKAVSI